MKTLLIPACVALSGLLAGCDTLGPNMRDGAVSKFGPGGLLRQPIEQVDLIALVSSGASKATPQATSALKDEAFPDEFEKALAQLRGKRNPQTGEPLAAAGLEYERNRIQDRLIMVSNDMCEEYKTVLKRKQSNANFFYGLTSIVAGAAGGVATGARAAGNWAALSGGSSAVRAEHNQDYYAEMAAQVITKGIVLKRRVIADAMQCARQQPERDYTLERAIADAVVYHGACSLVGGLESLDHVMTTFNANVGTDALAASQFYRPYLDKRYTELTGKPLPAAVAPQSPASAPENLKGPHTEAGVGECKPVSKAPDPAAKSSVPAGS
jgi:hypothetical protein